MGTFFFFVFFGFGFGFVGLFANDGIGGDYCTAGFSDVGAPGRGGGGVPTVFAGGVDGTTYCK